MQISKMSRGNLNGHLIERCIVPDFDREHCSWSVLEGTWPIRSSLDGPACGQLTLFRIVSERNVKEDPLFESFGGRDQKLMGSLTGSSL